MKLKNLSLKPLAIFVASSLILSLMIGCDNGSSSDSSSNPSPPVPPTPPVSASKPIASNVTVSNNNGVLSGTYIYSDEDGAKEGRTLLYWKENDALIRSGTMFNVVAKDLNKPLLFCVTPVTYDGVQGNEVCSNEVSVNAIQLSATMDFPTTIKNQLNIYQNVNVIPDSPTDNGLQKVNVGWASDAYIKQLRSDYDGFNLNDMGTYTRVDEDVFGISNHTPRTLQNPVVRVKLKSDGLNHFYQFNQDLAPFSSSELDSATRPFSVSDVMESQLIDPNPLYRNMIDHFVSADDADDFDPNFTPWTFIPESNDIFGYNKLFAYYKQYNNRLSTLLHYIDYFSEGKESIDQHYKCAANSYTMCNNPDFAIHAWGRKAKSEVDAKYYALQDIEASGLALVGGTGINKLGVYTDEMGKFDEIYEHEHSHNLGYGHESGMTSGWANEMYQWVGQQPYFDFINGVNTQVLKENSDYFYETEWVDNKTVKIIFHAKLDGALPLTSLAILAQDEQDPTRIGDDTTDVGVQGHQNNDFSISSVNQLSENTILITLNNPMRYAGNSLVVYAEPQYSKSAPGYVSLLVNNSNDIAIEDGDFGALMVDALDPDYKQDIYFNGSTGFLGAFHDPNRPTNTGLDDGIGGANLYNFSLLKYQSWDVNSAAEYCKKLGRKGLAYIDASNDNLTNLQDKYLNNAAIIALDSSNSPVVYKAGSDPTKGQLIACSLE